MTGAAPPIDFSTLYARLDHALERIALLEREINEFISTGPYESVREANSLTGALRWRVQIHAQPPLHLSFKVGDCIHAIRATLDNLTWLLSASATEKQRKRVQFVITAEEQEFREQSWRLTPVPQGARDIIERLQPFAPGELPPPIGVAVTLFGARATTDSPFFPKDPRGRAETHLLWVLDRLWNDDKHRAALLTAAVTHNFSVLGSFAMPPDSDIAWTSDMKGLHDGDVFLEATPVPRFSLDNVDVQPHFTLALDREGPRYMQPVTKLLTKLHDHVRNHVLPAFQK